MKITYRKSEGNSSSSSGGIGFIGLLTIVFITLKLTGYINWSWWWVWSPVLFAAGLWILIVGVILFAFWATRHYH